MAAPTPVSALVHSSTLVTAGVYLLIRFNLALEHLSMLTGLMVIGGVTRVMAGAGALFELDIKKVIALSTLRQLGIMIMIVGAGHNLLTFFHLLCHAFFKAILFMCAGILIHSIKEFQDLRAMGQRMKRLPFVTSIIFVANFSLCGLPFISGYYSKDLILEILIIGGSNTIAV